MENTIQTDYPMNPKEVAAYMKKSVRTIQNWMKQGELVGKRIGGSWIVMKSDLDKQLSR